MRARRDTFPVHGIGYQPVTPELREALRRYVATHTKREVEANLGSEDMVHRVVDMGTATRRVAARLATVLGCESPESASTAESASTKGCAKDVA